MAATTRIRRHFPPRDGGAERRQCGSPSSKRIAATRSAATTADSLVREGGVGAAPLFRVAAADFLLLKEPRSVEDRCCPDSCSSHGQKIAREGAPTRSPPWLQPVRGIVVLTLHHVIAKREEADRCTATAFAAVLSDSSCPREPSVVRRRSQEVQSCSCAGVIEAVSEMLLAACCLVIDSSSAKTRQ